MNGENKLLSSNAFLNQGGHLVSKKQRIERDSDNDTHDDHHNHSDHEDHDEDDAGCVDSDVHNYVVDGGGSSFEPDERHLKGWSRLFYENMPKFDVIAP